MNKIFYQRTPGNDAPRRGRAGWPVALSGVLLGLSVSANADVLDQAKRIHDRLAGVPPSEAVLLQMKAELDAGDGVAAAMIAMDDDGFYNVTLKNWAAPWTNREMDVFVPLNDYIATVVGVVKDGMDFREMLYADIIYVADPSLGLTAYSNSNNTHYEQLENGGYSLQDVLVQRPQSSITGLPADATAGVVTSRAAARSFFKAGTNRANFRFTLLNHLCMDLEQVHDVTRVPDRIRQDVSRSPGGDARVFLNNCLGCHSGMDPLAQAFAYYDYEYDADNDLTGENGQISYNAEGTLDPETNSRVKAKYRINSATFPYGYITPDDHWTNYWREGQNQILGWDPLLPGEGVGARSMLMELSHTEAFASCQVTKVFKAVCLREPGDSADRTQISNMTTDFKNAGYNIKQVFAESADYCKGE
ncbi:hypothetical protein P886_1829 [Alteromonadaceae bacterium 2753L.S.0a.02]|nr:hypothetical protein P886_1829 [Alteromonadaceae bacterium 2753L.S.0a.02]